MLEKDYILRLIQTFLDAVNEIVNKIDKKDIDGAKIQINETYNFLGQNAIFFQEGEIDDVVDFFKSKDDDYLARIKLLARLMYLDAKTKHEFEVQIKLMNKAKLLFEYYNSFSDEFCVEINEELTEINQFLKI